MFTKSVSFASLCLAITALSLSCATSPKMPDSGSRIPAGKLAIVGRISNQPEITQNLQTLGDAYQTKKTMVAICLSPEAQTRPMYLDAKGGVVIPATWGEWFIMLVPKNKPLWFGRGEVALEAKGGGWQFGVLDPLPPPLLDFEDSDEIVYIGDLVYHIEETQPGSGKAESYIEIIDNSASAAKTFTGYLMNKSGKPASLTTRLLARKRIPLSLGTWGYTSVVMWR